MQKLKKNKGITLIALIITIIILLILAGITISSLTQSGLFGKTNEAKEKTIKAQLKEEIEMAIAEIQIDELPKGNNVTLETLANGQLVNKLTDITSELENNEIIGEYKNYDYTIDLDFNIEIGGRIYGMRPRGTVEILTTGYMFEGNGLVEIKVSGSIEEGTITEIIAPSGATLKTDTSTTEKIYTVEKSGKYVFTIVGDSGRSINVTASVENILSVPQIKIDEITSDSFRINIENNYPEGVITEYKYYVEEEIKWQGTTDKSYIVTELVENTKYSVKIVAYINLVSRESNTETVLTLEEQWSEEYKETGDYIDTYGNVAKIPEGFQVSTKKGQTNLNEGLVVRNATDKNEFVWIPVGTIYTDEERTEANKKTIELNRYTFDTDGNPTAHDDEKIGNDQELSISKYNNTIAKDIAKFKTSVEDNKGYYIGRYEARTGIERISKNDDLTEVTEKGKDYVYNRITQKQAAELAGNMYNSTKFTSDLMNSYAWDTAIVFLQTCGTNTRYSRQNSFNTSLLKKGTNNEEEKDIQCNVYDMASNLTEWTTESHGSSNPCITRGGSYNVKDRYSSTREYNASTYQHQTRGFRVLLYL